MNVIDGMVLFSESKDVLSDGVPFWGAVRASLRRVEKLSFRILTEFMAQDTEAAVSVAEACGRLLRGQVIHEESAESLVLTVRGIGRF
jgi:hypothetical protein